MNKINIQIGYANMREAVLFRQLSFIDFVVLLIAVVFFFIFFSFFVALCLVR